MIKTVAAAALAAALLAPAAAMAHHSFSMFDVTKSVTINGVVSGFEWSNPHCWLRVMTTDAKGGQTTWSFEMTSPNLLARSGWRPATIKPGEKITVVGVPLRDGNPGAQFRSATLPDGRQLTTASVPKAGAPVGSAQ